MVVERSSAGLPKPGWIATQPGAACELQYSLPRDGAPREQLVGLGYLKSYEGMGRVQVTCVRGCSCKPVTLDGHNEAKISPYDLHYMTVQTHNTTGADAAAGAAGVNGLCSAAMCADGTCAPSRCAVSLSQPPTHCALRLTVLNTTSSEGHKFKLTALFLNRQSGKAFFGGWIFRKAMDGKEKDMGKGDGWGASFRKVAGDRGGSRRKSRAASRGARAPSLLQRRAKRKGKEPKLKVA